MIRGSESRELDRRVREEALLDPLRAVGAQGSAASGIADESAAEEQDECEDDGYAQTHASLRDDFESSAQAHFGSSRAFAGVKRSRSVPSARGRPRGGAVSGFASRKATARGGVGMHVFAEPIGAHQRSAYQPAVPADPQAAQPSPFLHQTVESGSFVQASPPHAAPAPELGQIRDVCRVPAELDAAYEAQDPSAAIRATVITPTGSWTLRSLKHLLAKAPSVSTLGAPEQKAARGAAFDLIDALSRSGTLPLTSATLHIVLAATHAFDLSILDTVVQESVNPIERVERSLLVMATTLHGLPASQLLREEHVERLCLAAPPGPAQQEQHPA